MRSNEAAHDQSATTHSLKTPRIHGLIHGASLKGGDAHFGACVRVCTCVCVCLIVCLQWRIHRVGVHSGTAHRQTRKCGSRVEHATAEEGKDATWGEKRDGERARDQQRKSETETERGREGGRESVCVCRGGGMPNMPAFTAATLSKAPRPYPPACLLARVPVCVGEWRRTPLASSSISGTAWQTRSRCSVANRGSLAKQSS
jgi:hypothetical protein